MPNNAISVLIPTRERAELLQSAIQSCLAQKYDNCVFIVSDNFSADHTRDVVQSFRDPRLVYVNPGQRLSMAGNFEFALSQARPGYVLSIGDDDALMPDALGYLDSLIEETKAEAIAGRWNCYVWNNYPIEESRNFLHMWLGQGFSVRQSREEVRRTLGFNYSYVHKLAGLYYGLVSTNLIQRLRRAGTFFHSMTPDAYSAFACSLAAKHFIYSHKPFVLAGLSGKSNGASQLLNINSSEVEKYVKENTHSFHDALNYCPAEAVILAEAFLQLKDTHPELTEGIDFSVTSMCINALRQAFPNARTAVEAAIKEVAKKHPDIDLRRVQYSAKLPAVGARIRKEIDEFIVPRFSVVCDPLQIKNIADATTYADAITKEREGQALQTWMKQQKDRVFRKVEKIRKAKIHRKDELSN